MGAGAWAEFQTGMGSERGGVHGFRGFQTPCSVIFSGSMLLRWMQHLALFQSTFPMRLKHETTYKLQPSASFQALPLQSSLGSFAKDPCLYVLGFHVAAKAISNIMVPGSPYSRSQHRVP